MDIVFQVCGGHIRKERPLFFRTQPGGKVLPQIQIILHHMCGVETADVDCDHQKFFCTEKVVKKGRAVYRIAAQPKRKTVDAVGQKIIDCGFHPLLQDMRGFHFKCRFPAGYDLRLLVWWELGEVGVFLKPLRCTFVEPAIDLGMKGVRRETELACNIDFIILQYKSH